MSIPSNTALPITLGTIAMRDVTCTVAVSLHTAKDPSDTWWDLSADDAETPVLTWHTSQRHTSPRAVLAAAPLALAAFRPDLLPEIPGDLAQWTERATVTGGAYQLPVLSVETDKQTVTLYAYFNPELNSVVGRDPADMSVAFPDTATGGRMLLFPVASPEVSAVDLFERLRRAPMDLR